MRTERDSHLPYLSLLPGVHRMWMRVYPAGGRQVSVLPLLGLPGVAFQFFYNARVSRSCFEERSCSYVRSQS